MPIDKNHIAGVIYANKAWDQILRFRTDAFFIGFVTRLFALYAAATTHERSKATLDAVRMGVETLEIVQATRKKPQ